MRFTMALTHEELANMVGSSRETVTRMLGRFKRDKLIQMRGSSILILSQERLEQLSS
jgi:CRP/FNR family transcriptional regulator, cyclic AMP receptor protein